MVILASTAKLMLMTVSIIIVRTMSTVEMVWPPMIVCAWQGSLVNSARQGEVRYCSILELVVSIRRCLSSQKADKSPGIKEDMAN